MNKSSPMTLLLMMCFLLSGAAGLIYEVVWSRQLSLFVGITTYAHTAVITAYMLGLALGSYAIGRFSDRHPSPLRLFAWLEVAIALYAAATPWLCSWLQMVYSALAKNVGITGLPSHILRFFLVLVLLLPPTFLMGGTLPVMVRGMTRNLPDLAHSSGRLYGINTIGAVLGTLLAGYVLLPLVGLRVTLFVGVAFDLIVAAAIMMLCRNLESVPVREITKTPNTARSSTGRIVLVLFGVSGFAALAYQIAWIRALTLVLGSSVFSFSTTLATFLTGIALGSLLYPYLPGGRDEKSRLIQAGVVTAVTGYSAVMGLWVIGRLPDLFLWGFQQGWNTHFTIFQGFTFALSFLVMIVPTLMLGMMFPLMASLWARRPAAVGEDVGVVYAANTVGCIAGALLAGLVLLPLFGAQGTIILAAGIHVMVAALFLLRSRPVGAALKRIIAVCGFVAGFAGLVWIAPAWDRAIMTTGVFNYADSMVGATLRESVLSRANAFTMLYYNDGRDGTVNVLERDGQQILVVNGKIDASSQADLPTQIMLAQMPMLMHERPLRVLIVGLGSGITAGSLAMHAAVEHIDIVELSPEVVEASAYFADSNRRILEDPRVHLVIGDARNFLLATDHKYDVIITQPSNPWISGVANLFTYDFFKLLESRLAPGGLVSQWFQIYNMSPDDTRSVLRSFQAVFPHVSAWLSMDNDLMMVGSLSPHALDVFRIKSVMEQPEIVAMLRAIHMNSVGQIVKMFLFRDDVLAAYCQDAPLNTDDRPRIEFSAPQNLYRYTTGETLKSMVHHIANFAQPTDAPMTNLARWVGACLEVPSVELAISASVEPWPENWSVERRIWREIIPSDQSHPAMMGVGSQVWLAWRDREMDHRLRAFYIAHDQTHDQLGHYLDAFVADPRLAVGEVDLPGGARGVWLLSQKAPSGGMTFSVAWTMPSSYGGYFQYVAERDVAELGQAEWGPALLDFVKSFSRL